MKRNKREKRRKDEDRTFLGRRILLEHTAKEGKRKRYHKCSQIINTKLIHYNFTLKLQGIDYIYNLQNITLV